MWSVEGGRNERIGCACVYLSITSCVRKCTVSVLSVKLIYLQPQHSSVLQTLYSVYTYLLCFPIFRHAIYELCGRQWCVLLSAYLKNNFRILFFTQFVRVRYKFPPNEHFSPLAHTFIGDVVYLFCISLSTFHIYHIFVFKEAVCCCCYFGLLSYFITHWLFSMLLKQLPGHE